MITEISSLYRRLAAGDRTALGQAITLVESANPDHRSRAAELLDFCTRQTSQTFRFAVSGAPGVGKSTFIEALGELIVREAGNKLAVLAVDPSSPVSRGAILGDKTRMVTLSRHPRVFVRPTAAGSAAGGIADTTREVMILCEAAGYNLICIETVGAGQSDIQARAVTDFFLLLVLPGSGDELQGMKRGIVEMADMIAITKADGKGAESASRTQRHYAHALHLFAAKEHGIPVQVVTCSARDNTGIADIWEHMQSFRAQVRASGFLTKQRDAQNLMWLETRLTGLAKQVVLSSKVIHDRWTEIKHLVSNQELSVSSALGEMERLLQEIFQE